MNQRKNDNATSRDLVPVSAEQTRLVKGEPVYGDYYYSYSQSRSAQVKSYLSMISRQRWLMLGVFLAIVTVGLAWLATRTPLYQSSAEMLVTPVDRGSSTSDNIAQSIDTMTKMRTVATQVKLMQSPDILSAAFSNVPQKLRVSGFGTSETKLTNYPVTISNPKDTEIIDIQVLSPDRKAAAEFANQLLNTAMNSRSLNIKTMAKLATQQVDEELAQTEVELNKARRNLAEHKSKYGIAALPDETASDAESLANLESEVSKAESDLLAAQRKRAAMEGEIRHTPMTTVSAVVTDRNPLIASMDTDIEKLEKDLSQLMLEYQPTAPEVMQKKREIEQAKARRTQQLTTITSSKTEGTNPLYETLRTEYINSIVAQHEAQSRLSVMRSHAAMMRSRINMLPEFEEKLATLMSRVAELENAHAYLASQKNGLQLSMQGGLPNVIPITHAMASRFPVSPNIPISLLAITVFAALASVGAAMLREQLDDRIHTSDKLESTAGYRVLASIPTVRNGFRGLVTDDASPRGLLENFRILRNSIFLTAQQEVKPHVIVVTSPYAGEGKTTTVANLAMTTALSHKRVLIIDGDMRHPSAHLAFGLSNEEGLSTVLQGDTELAACIQETSHENLHVLPAGPTPAFPPELLASPAMSQLLAQVRGEYDSVLLDSTPVVNLSDAAQLASLADGVIMVVSAARTEQGKLQEALRILEQAGVPILGIVYNRSTDTPLLEWEEAEDTKAIEYHDDHSKAA